MNVRDYLIDHASFDWQKLFANWHWRVPGKFTVWLMNRFGDLFITKEDGSIFRLRMDDGSLTCVAQTKDEFCEKIDQTEVANDWLMIPLVDRLVAAGKILKEEECYAFIQLPLLGGDYVIENIVIRRVDFQYAAMGPVHEKLNGISDGARVSFRIKK